LAILHKHLEQYKTDVPVLLTLTVPNVTAFELKDRLDLMYTAWGKMSRRMPFRRAVRGWFRALEVTYNADREDYHPHFHVLLIVPKNYFDKRYVLYIERDDWLGMWQRAMRMSEITQVDIRKVKKRSKKDAIASLCAEVGKYATKPSDYLRMRKDGSYEAESEVVRSLHYALRNRRLVAYGGVLKAIKQELKLVDVENADLVKIEEEDKVCHCPICQSTLIETIYRWRLGLKEYMA
jgi:plasmid rolling circle replication initiator protein Rep